MAHTNMRNTGWPKLAIIIAVLLSLICSGGVQSYHMASTLRPGKLYGKLYGIRSLNAPGVLKVPGPLFASTAASMEPDDTIKPKILSNTSPARKTLKKIIPLGLMLFFILFNYTILRDTKDVLIVTAPNSGAEIIPFLKTYVNLPSAIAFTLAYSSLCNRMSPDKVFYLVMTAFVTFFWSFRWHYLPKSSFSPSQSYSGLAFDGCTNVFVSNNINIQKLDVRSLLHISQYVGFSRCVLAILGLCK